MALAILRHHCIAIDMINMGIDQRHIGLDQGAVPAVVEQHALAERGVIRKHFAQEILARTQLSLDIALEELPVLVVAPVDGTLRMRPLRVDLYPRMDASV